MTEPKYQIGDRIPKSPFIVRGIMTPSDGNHRYFIQINDSDNTFVGTEDDLKNAIDIVNNAVDRHYAKKHKSA